MLFSLKNTEDAINPHQLKRLFPNASQSVLDANKSDYGKAYPETGHTGEVAKLERPAGEGALAAPQAKEADSERVRIRIISVRKRLLDPDNLSEKWTIDCLRYCRVIRGDEPDKITLETTQRKCEKGEEEHTEILIYEEDSATQGQ